MNYTINEKKIVYADLDPSEGVVLNLHTKNYYRLNETGQLVWQELSAGKPLDAIATTLTEKYEITFDEAMADVKKLIDQMKFEQLLEEPAQKLASYSIADAQQSKKSEKYESKT